MSSSNCCFLVCIQISQETSQVVWYSPVSQNFLQFIVIRTVKGFGLVNKAERDVFLESTETSGGLWEWWHDPGVPLAFPVVSASFEMRWEHRELFSDHAGKGSLLSG